MVKFFKKSIIFTIPLIVLVKLPTIIPITFHDDLNRKINTFINNENDYDIIIGGDSRAERHIIPKIFKNRLSLNSVNIAVNSGDITMLYEALKKEKLLNHNNNLIISISSIEMNDNVVNKWGIPHAAVAQIPEWKNVKLFGKHYLNMIHERIRLMFNELFLPPGKIGDIDSRNSTLGFLGIDGDISNWDFDSINLMEDTLKVGWYLNGHYNGAKKKVFCETIDKYSKTNLNLVLFQPPVSPAWSSHTSDTYIDSIEHDHINFLQDISAQYKNISFIDFYSNLNPVFHDSMFYNSLHLNRHGAELFTNVLIDSLVTRKLLITENIEAD